MTDPHVSVVLPSYDGARHLDEAIASVTRQTYKDWELVLVNDGSADGTGAMMDAWAAREARIRVRHLEPNRGLPAALNAGFDAARGGLFTWTSDDNLMLPGAIERMVERISASDEVDVVAADFAGFDTSGRSWVTRVASPRWLPLRNLVGYCFLYRREVHEALGGFDTGLFLAEDYDFWLRASRRFRFDVVPEVLYRARVHGESLSARNSARVALAVADALERSLPSFPAAERAHARLHRADRLFRCGESRRARTLVRRALGDAPSVALRAGHRRTLAASVLGWRAARRLPTSREQPRVRFVVPDLLGGVTAWNLDVASTRPADGPPQVLCWLEDGRPENERNVPEAPERVDRVARVRHRWPDESLFAVLRRMHRQLGAGPGVVVANEFFGLAYAARYGADRHVVQLLHGDLPMYYTLAETFAPWVDVFVTVSGRIRDELRRRLPDRAADIRHLRSGVPIPSCRRTPHAGPLRLVYSGRLDAAKGVLALPEIDRIARAQGAPCTWTILGAGPAEDALRRGFAAEARVVFRGALTRETARAELSAHDVLVLPSHAEGLPLALLEAMAAGLVPVASRLASGVQEVVAEDATGFLAHPDQPGDFAEAVVRLSRDRALLERLSAGAVERVAARHDLSVCGPAFHALLDDLRGRPLPYRPRYARGPSRLDRPWLPNALVRGIHAARPGARR